MKNFNPIAKLIKRIKPSIVLAKKGKGSYNRARLKFKC